MTSLYATPGKSCPVFVAGIKYRSIAAAAGNIDITDHWLIVRLKKKHGGPVVAKKQFVVTEAWIKIWAERKAI